MRVSLIILLLASPVLTQPVLPPPAPGACIAETLPGGGAMEFVYIPPGALAMGSPDSGPGGDDDERPQHEAAITQGFYLGRYEVTQGQWQAVMGTTPWAGQDYVQASPDHPAVCGPFASGPPTPARSVSNPSPKPPETPQDRHPFRMRLISPQGTSSLP